MKTKKKNRGSFFIQLHDVKQLCGKLKEIPQGNIRIISHINPDPDTLGSALALKEILMFLGKKACCVCDGRINDRMKSFMEITQNEKGIFFKNGEEDLTADAHEEFVFTIAADTAAPHLLGNLSELHSENEEENKIDLVIDHHYTNVIFGKTNFIDDTAAATAEIMFDVAKELGMDLRRYIDAARFIYCAIITDCGSFKYSNTTPKTMRAAAELIGTDFDFAKMNRLIFQNKSLIQVNIERLAYNNLRFFADGKIGMISITEQIKKEAGLEGVEIEGITDIARIIEGVEVGITIKQKGDAENETYKISMRSNDYVNVAEIAALFGGGGHKRAAGCKAEMSLCDLETKIISEIEKAL